MREAGRSARIGVFCAESLSWCARVPSHPKMVVAGTAGQPALRAAAAHCDELAREQLARLEGQEEPELRVAVVERADAVVVQDDEVDEAGADRRRDARDAERRCDGLVVFGGGGERRDERVTRRSARSVLQRGAVAGWHSSHLLPL